MPDATTREQLSIDEYRAEVLGLVHPPQRRMPTSDGLGVTEAIGWILADDVVAAGDVPGFDMSAMDGYAVRFDDLVRRPARLRIVAELPAGSSDDPSLRAGECARIMTGAALPTDADTVVPLEATKRVDAAGASAAAGDHVDVVEPPRRGRGANVRRRGDDLAAGDVVARAGTQVTPALTGALLGAGLARVPVWLPPRLAIVATGDELVPAGTDRARGQVWESNAHQLSATATRWGARVPHTLRLPDDPDRFTATLDDLVDSGVDLIVIAGGTSVGDRDVARIALEAQPESAFRHVRIRPGRPQGWAVWRGTPVVCLPGNPGAAAISFELFVRPMVWRMSGRDAGPDRPGWAHGVQVLAGSSWSSVRDRTDVVPVRLRVDTDGVLHAVPLADRGSHHVTTLVGADALALVPEGVSGVSQETSLELWGIA